MKEEKREKRKQQIRAAAYELLERNGYKATSMLAIAKKAKASNETLYAWYGTKENLFRSLIEENAAEVKEAIIQALGSNANIHSSLNGVGRLLLTLVTSEKAVSLNRAAATDASGTNVLGPALASAGRQSVTPLLKELILQARSGGQLQFTDQDDVVRIYLGLLIGDLQIQRVIGVKPVLSQKEITGQSEAATAYFLRLFGVAGD